ncbi:LOW QUALITY PROTEIN: sodium-coupled monocarboxylate transporter 1-like [Penaeus monodon]|uniref:LOW QUALITY PROTEIN: sodium-coupled monocarboxylate transporter 1-like n=1 Tax=Penaeus monodon TaxID=6687 RepID=UPI0018A72130|nr:LOW QUALITY PROTEIN: sodium-coupled monocarboxylate transporter 1-like [Penaeus monodon]
MGLGVVDILFLTLSVLVSAIIGLYQGYVGRRATPECYLMGSRKMKPLPLAMSMMVGTVSAITIMGNAGEMYAYGTQLWIMDLGIILALVLIAKVMIPIIHPMEVVSLYEYIEKRFNAKWLRQATVVLQLVGGYFFMGFLLYPPSIALQAFTGLSILLNIFIMGATCTFYSAIGGVKAVVYTDVFQAVVMVVGVLAIVVIGSVNVGGLHVVWDIAYHHNRTELFNMDLDPYQRHSFWLCIILGFFFTLGTYGVNQSQTQRFFSTKSVQDAQKVIYFAAVGMVILRALIHLAGLAIYAHFYRCDPLAVPGAGEPAYVVIVYVLTVLTRVPGLAGIFVAAIYAAVLSSVSTQLNSMTALLWADFLKPHPFFASFSEVKAGALQKIIVLLSGIVAIVLGLVVSTLGRSFLRALFAITGALSGPLIGLFAVGLFLPWVNLKGASAGFFISIILSVWLAIGQLLSQTQEPFLTMSREGCPVTNTSTTAANVTTLAATTSTSVASVTDVTTEASLPTEEESVRGIYGLSYCLNSFLGVVICVVVAAVVTAATGTNSLDDVDQYLVNGTAWRVFEKLAILRGRESPLKKVLQRSGSTSKENGKRDNRVKEEMVEKEPLPTQRETKNNEADGSV